MRKKILIVEDNEDVALGLTVRFAGVGFEVRSVASAPEAIRAVDLFEPHLVILDLLIPGGGGFAVLKSLKAAPHTSRVPIIVTTGLDDHDYKERIRSLGVNALLEKPCEPEILLEKTRELLDIAPKIEEKILIKSRTRRGKASVGS
jgi:DNA-binding response OmpR family regulator